MPKIHPCLLNCNLAPPQYQHYKHAVLVFSSQARDLLPGISRKISKRTPFWFRRFCLKSLPCNNTTYNYSLVAVQAKKLLPPGPTPNLFRLAKKFVATAPNYVVVTGGTLLPYIIYILVFV